MKRNKSIVHEQGKCWVCGTTQNLHTHEVFFGTANRKKSIEWGCYVDLCGKHHNLSNEGVHFDKALDIKLKRFTQKKFEELHGHEKFMQIFHRNYL